MQPVMVRDYTPIRRDLGQTSTPIRLPAEPWSTEARPFARQAAKATADMPRAEAVLNHFKSSPAGTKQTAARTAKAIGEPSMMVSKTMDAMWRQGTLSRTRQYLRGHWVVEYALPE